MSILRLTGLDVRLGSLLPEIAEPTVVELANGATLTLEPLRRSGSRLGLDDFDPCAVLLNNDLSPPASRRTSSECDEQWLIPPPNAGWHKRRKSNHAAAYDRSPRASSPGDRHRPVAHQPRVRRAARSTSRSAPAGGLANQVDSPLTRIRAKYKEYGVTDEPFVVVKADAGTYGMGVMTVKGRLRSSVQPPPAQQDGGGEGKA